MLGQLPLVDWPVEALQVRLARLTIHPSRDDLFDDVANTHKVRSALMLAGGQVGGVSVNPETSAAPLRQLPRWSS